MSSLTSKDPHMNKTTKKVRDLQVTGMPDLSWTIVMMSGAENVGIVWSGNIMPGTQAIFRSRESKCYDDQWENLLDCDHGYAEILDFYSDNRVDIGAFLDQTQIHDAYLMIYNETHPKDISIQTNKDTPFTLPELTIEAESRKNESLQVFRFREDKSRYYDALKYGVYNNDGP